MARLADDVFNCVTVRDYADTQNTAMYPRADGTTNSIHLDRSVDGTNVKRAVGRSLEISHLGQTKQHQQVFLDEVKLELLVTDQRVAFAVPKYDKGGGWYGGATALMINAASKARAAIRTKGSCLVGHIHYPWLSHVDHTAYYSMMGNRKHDRLRLGYSVRGANGQQIDVVVAIDLARDVSGHGLAEEIVKRAAAYRLERHPDLKEEQRQDLLALAESGVSTKVTKDRWTMTHLPATKLALPETASYPEQDLPQGGTKPSQAVPVPPLEPEPESESVAQVEGPEGVNTTLAGWYPDHQDSQNLRWWDGEIWTEHLHPASVGGRPLPLSSSRI